MQSNSQIQALLHLLDDPDENVFSSVKNKIISFGKDIVPNLEGHWESTTDPALQKRIEDIIRIVNFQEVLDSFTVWSCAQNPELFEGMLILNYYRFANPNENNTRKLMKTMYQSAWLEMNNYLAPMEQVNVLASIIYNMYKLQNHETNADNINYFFINHLLSTKNGNVHSLNAIYLILCNLLSIPIKPVQIPGQFMLAYVDTVYDYLSPKMEPIDKILFYIDAASGMVYTQSDVDAYLKKSNLPAQHSADQLVISTKQFMKTYLQQLLKCYETTDLINEKEKELLQLIDLL
jgi:regulator of sirC expression with transglutaminase-like and TPR domain